jgi:hypothetical protein
MITFFTTAKAFKGHFGLIQTNAIRSWTRLRPECEIIIFGRDEGVAGIAAELSIANITDLEYSKEGMPRLDSMFRIAQDRARHDLICFINADIILLSDFIQAVNRVKESQTGKFLMIGRRWDVNIDYLVDFNNDNWEKLLRKAVGHSRLHPCSGMDYFVFPRGTYRDIPALVAARTGFDNWLVYRAREMRLPVIEATRVATVIHQNHDYSNFPGGWKALLATADAASNREIVGRPRHSFCIHHATLVPGKSGLKKPMGLKYLYANWTARLVIDPRLKILDISYKKLLSIIFAFSKYTGISKLYRKFIKPNNVYN